MELYEVIDVKRPKEPSKPIAYKLKNLDTDHTCIVKGSCGSTEDNVVNVKFKLDGILKRFKKVKE